MFRGVWLCMTLSFVQWECLGLSGKCFGISWDVSVVWVCFGRNWRTQSLGRTILPYCQNPKRQDFSTSDIKISNCFHVWLILFVCQREMIIHSSKKSPVVPLSNKLRSCPILKLFLRCPTLKLNQECPILCLNQRSDPAKIWFFSPSSNNALAWGLPGNAVEMRRWWRLPHGRAGKPQE